MTIVAHTTLRRGFRVTRPGLAASALLLYALTPACSNDSAPLASIARSGSVEAILDWRALYGRYLGLSKAEVLKVPMIEPINPDKSAWRIPPSMASLDREVIVMFFGETCTSIKVFAGDYDVLDVEAVIQKGPMFTFSSGMFKDSTASYFQAATPDSRNVIQFACGPTGVTLAAVTFVH